MKTINRENYRVEVYPFLGHWRTETDHNGIMQVLAKIQSSIQRHVDDIDGTWSGWDTTYICSFCGREWEVDVDGCPVCCDEAVAEWENEQ